MNDDTPSNSRVWMMLRAMFGNELTAATLVILRHKEGETVMDTFGFPSSGEIERMEVKIE